MLEKNKSPSDRNINKYCRENPQYDPNQPLEGEDRTFGQPITNNPFLKCFGRGSSPRETTLGGLNKLVTEYNDEKPIGVTKLTTAEQQTLFSNNATSAIKPMLSINQFTVTQFKADSFHLHNCCHEGMMGALIRRAIPEGNRQMITDLVHRIPFQHGHKRQSHGRMVEFQHV